MKELHLVSSGDRINVDFSSFVGFEVLTFAKQTNLGRAIPVYFSLLRYPITDPGSQTLFIIKEVKKFLALTGKNVTLVFDRGFELPRVSRSASCRTGEILYQDEKRQICAVLRGRAAAKKPSMV